MRILCAVASGRDWKPHFGMSFAFMYGMTWKHGDKIGLETLDIYALAQQSCFSTGREKIIQHAIRRDYTHVALFDDDMEFPPETILQFASYDLDFVCANARRKIPEVSGICLDFDSNRINSTGKSGLEQVGFGIMACTLIKVDAIKRSGGAPFFEVVWNVTANGYTDADHYFFCKLGRAGIDFWVDHDISHKVKHVGDHAYGFQPTHSDTLNQLKELGLFTHNENSDKVAAA